MLLLLDNFGNRMAPANGRPPAQGLAKPGIPSTFPRAIASHARDKACRRIVVGRLVHGAIGWAGTCPQANQAVSGQGMAEAPQCRAGFPTVKMGKSLPGRFQAQFLGVCRGVRGVA
jgi:hypothetical protein